MARLPLITSKDQVPAKDHAIVDGIIGSRGSLHGPFSMFLHSPEMAGRVAHLGAYVRFEGTLDFRVRVLAAMTVAREFEAEYVWGAQTGSARRQNVPETTIAAIRENRSDGIPAEDLEIIEFTRPCCASTVSPMPRPPRSEAGSATTSSSSSPALSATTACCR